MKKSVKKDPVHEPVLTKEVIEYLRVKKIAHLNTQARFIDATIGAAGHSIEIVKFGGIVLGIDQDPSMLKIAEKNIEEACPATFSSHERSPYKLIHGNFRNIDKLAKRSGFDHVDGILFDLGVSNIHFSSTSRGFSYRARSSPLDMRIDPEAMGVTAGDMLNSLPEDKLFKLFESVLPYQNARKLSERIVVQRSKHKIVTVGDFANIIKTSVVKKRRRKAHSKTIDLNTMPFMALRMAVNSELGNLSEALPKSFDLLKKGGRLVVISFHSGEDKIVKRFFIKMGKTGQAKNITKKPIVPTTPEVKKNPRSRSAKMRVLKKFLKLK